MTDEQLQQLAALAEAATPGPWWVDQYATDMSCTEHAVGVRADDMVLASMGIDDVAMPDARFIVAARQAVPELLAEVSDLRRQLAEAQAAIAAVPRPEIAELCDFIDNSTTAISLDCPAGWAVREWLETYDAADCRQERDAAIADAAELRRQLTEERMRANAAEFAVAQLRADAADLRRQVDRAGYEYREVQRALVEVGEATGADDPTSPGSILDALADLRRQLEHANRWRDNEILAANEARAESADLRRQLAETQATIAALRIATAAYAEIAAICPACGGGGEVNSGRVTPHGDEIYVICPTCQGSGRAYIADTPHRAGKGDMFARGEMVSADAMPDVQPTASNGAAEPAQAEAAAA